MVQYGTGSQSMSYSRSHHLNENSKVSKEPFVDDRQESKF
jgi:hypothetical protein